MTKPINDAIYFNTAAQANLEDLKSIRSKYHKTFNLEYEEVYAVMNSLDVMEAQLKLEGNALKEASVNKPIWKRILNK